MAKPPAKKEETDYVALQSAFMKIPRMKVAVARDLMDLGFSQIYELRGRSPEGLFDALRKLRPQAQADRLPFFRLAVYVAETPDPDRAKLHPDAWR